MLKRSLLWGLSGVLVLVLLAGLTAHQLLRASLPITDGERLLPGLAGDVLIQRDQRGVPRVTAGHALDVARATGFLHAQERFFQMDSSRRAGAGELSALFGEVALDFDRERRRWRGRWLAQQALASLPAHERELLAAYSEGVNAGLKALRARPPEYWLLGGAPEAWQPEDSLLVNLSMFFYLTDADAERALGLDRMARQLPDSLLDFLLAPIDPLDAPLQEEVYPPLPDLPTAEEMDVRGFDLEGVNWERVLPGGSPLPGSNAWAVAGDGEAAMLAGDMHLGLSLPNTWYRMELAWERPRATRLVGVSLPGVPGIVAGSNGHVAWSFTNSYGDWSTRVRLLMDPEQDGHYLTPQGPRPLHHHAERIVVRGGEDETVSYPWTDWGPVVSGAEDERHALYWTGARPGSINVAFRSLYRARDLDQALAAGPDIGMPPQNLVVADRHGDVGWTIAGRIPRRGEWIKPGGRLPPSDAFHPDHGWLDGQDYPRVARPGHGRIWTANARVASDDDLLRVGDGGYPLAARQAQIRDRLFEAERLDPATMLAIQLDDEARLLYQWVPLALATADGAEGTAGRQRFRDAIAAWRGRAIPESLGYSLLRAFRLTVHRQALAPLLYPVARAHEDFDYRFQRRRESQVRHLLTARPPHLLAARYDHWDALLVTAMDAVIAAHEQSATDAWPTWGDRNRLRMRHPLSGSLPGLGRWLDMPAVALPGDSNLPRVQRPGFGASQRLVVRPGREEEGVFHMPGGQSGHPLSPWYRAGHEAWREGRATALRPDAPIHELRLRAE